MKQSLLLLIIISAFYTLHAQSPPSFSVHNYTINDGLPSNECHDILQDSFGYIWIATDRGLVRYDGYKFKTYGAKEGLLDISCLEMDIDSKQNIWVLTFSGKIYYLDREQNKVNLFEYYDHLEPFISKEGFIIDSRDRIHLTSNFGEVVLFDTEDVSKTIELKIPPQTKTIYSVDNKFMLSRNSSRHHSIERGLSSYIVKGLQLPEMKMDVLSVNGVGKIYGDTLIVCSKSQGLHYRLDTDLYQTFERDNCFVDLIQSSKGGYFIGAIYYEGLKYCSSLQDIVVNNTVPILEGVSVSRIYQDNRGDLWVCTLENGMYYLMDVVFSNYREEFVGADILDLQEQKDCLFLIKDKSEIYVTGNKRSTQLGSFPHILSLQSISNNQLLVNGNKSYVVNSDNNKNSFDIENTSHTKWWKNFENGAVVAASDRVMLGMINYQEIEIRRKNGRFLKARILSCEEKSDGKFIASTPKKVVSMSDDGIEDIENLPQELNIRCNDIIKIDSFYFFATQGSGLVIWDLNDVANSITTDDGLVSNNVEKLYLSGNTIYALTKSGYSCIEFYDQNNYRVRNYTISHGLPSNQVNDILLYKDTLLVATDRGLSYAKEKNVIDTIALSPIIESVLIDNHIQVSDTILQVDQNYITIVFNSFDFRQLGKTTYRYKLNQRDWNITNSTTLEFSNLGPGRYRFEVQARNVDGFWSNSASYNFNILPPWWQRWWFYTTGALVLGILGYYFYRIRLRRMQYRLKIEREVTNLERSALQAQMNPHFIFNCLNSIQNFLMKNEKEEAMNYLSRFAKLIRKNLNASTTQLISLEDEIDILENYLALEKLRLNNSFVYSISYTDISSTTSILIPPMLIQPLVENAVLHGMKEKTRGGKIDLTFTSAKDQLNVIVKDNGTSWRSSEKDPSHKSLGMSITEKRLKYNQRQHSNDFSIVPVHDDKGTTVTISIKTSSHAS